MKNYFYVLIVLCLLACHSNDAEFERYKSYQLTLYIENDTISKLSDYQYAYGVGMGNYNKLIKYDYSGYHWNARPLYSDSSFLVPLNINSDTSVFCLKRYNSEIDTFQLTYHRKPMFNKDEFFVEISNVQLNYVSAAFELDSCFVRLLQPLPLYSGLISLRRK